MKKKKKWNKKTPLYAGLGSNSKTFSKCQATCQKELFTVWKIRQFSSQSKSPRRTYFLNANCDSWRITLSIVMTCIRGEVLVYRKSKTFQYSPLYCFTKNPHLAKSFSMNWLKSVSFSFTFCIDSTGISFCTLIFYLTLDFYCLSKCL